MEKPSLDAQLRAMATCFAAIVTKTDIPHAGPKRQECLSRIMEEAEATVNEWMDGLDGLDDERKVG